MGPFLSQFIPVGAQIHCAPGGGTPCQQVRLAPAPRRGMRLAWEPHLSSCQHFGQVGAKVVLAWDVDFEGPSLKNKTEEHAPRLSTNKGWISFWLR